LRPLFSALLFFLLLGAKAQVGEQGFQILNLPSSARSASLGGNPIALAEQDLSLVGENPALLDSVENQSVYFQFSPFLGGVNLFNVGYYFEAPGINGIAATLSYLSYGELDRTDPTGTNLGTFTPRDFVFQVSKSHRLGPFVIGAGLKYINSSIDGMGASALAGDLGGVFTHPNIDLSFGVVIKNLGFAFSNFASVTPDLPTDLQIGSSFKPRYMPARFTVNFSMIGTDLGYFDSTPTDELNPSGVDALFRHLSAGLELYVGKAFTAMVGYNHLRNQELRLAQGNYGAGFSFGFNVKIKKFDIMFSRATYHAAGGLNTFGISTNLTRTKKIF